MVNEKEGKKEDKGKEKKRSTTEEKYLKIFYQACLI